VDKSARRPRKKGYNVMELSLKGRIAARHPNQYETSQLDRNAFNGDRRHQLGARGALRLEFGRGHLRLLAGGRDDHLRSRGSLGYLGNFSARPQKTRDGRFDVGKTREWFTKNTRMRVFFYFGGVFWTKFEHILSKTLNDCPANCGAQN